MKVTFEEAMSSEAAARAFLRDKDVPSSEKGEVIAKYGAHVVNDSTEYQIDDDSVEAAKEKGKEHAKNATDGFDGKSDGTSSAISAVGNVLTGAFGSIIGVLVSIVALSKKITLTNASGYMAAAYGAVMLANATYIKAADPNKEPADACEQMNEVMQEEQCSLSELQEDMTEAADEVLELTEKAEEKNKEANEKIEENKTLFDINKQQYDALKVKKDSGAELTSDEQSLMMNLAPTMQQLGDEITTTTEETSDEVNDINDEIGEYQDLYDNSAERIAEVQGETEFLAEFDEATVDNAKMVSFTSKIGIAGSGGIAAMGAAAIATSGLDIGAKIAGGVAIAESAGSIALLGNVIKHQNEYQAKAEAAVNARHETEDLNVETTEMYEEDIDNYADSIDLVENLELEVPEEMEMPAGTVQSSPSMMSMAAEQEQNQNGDQQPQGPNGVKSNSKNNANDNDPKKKKEEDEK